MRILRAALSSLLALCLFAWLVLYFDSVHQRIRAERLISDLKSFPFSSAGFAEARSVSARYGGKPFASPVREPGCSVRAYELKSG